MPTRSLNKRLLRRLVEPGPRDQHLFVLSARTETALDAATDNLVRHLRACPSLDPADVASTLQRGRRAFDCRRFVVARDLIDAADTLESRNGKRVVSQSSPRRRPPVAFLFPGQGAQTVNMGTELYRAEPVFRAEIDRCAELIAPQLGGTDLRASFRTPEQLNQTRFTQPALFTFGYALARLWMSWGVEPTAMLGHSVGEYVAAALSGVFTVEDALRLVTARAELVQSQPGGTMLAVRLPENQLAGLLAETNGALSIAAINSPTLCVVSGLESEVAAFESVLNAHRAVSRRLNTSHAFHSAMMDPVVQPFTALVEKVTLHPPEIPFVSNLTGRWITDTEATDPCYWARHLRESVRFADGVGELLAARPDSVLLEVGPVQTLTPMIRQHPSAAKGSGVTVFSTLQDGRNESEAALGALGRLWLEGVPVDWAVFHAAARRKCVSLPTYPFERKRYWIEPPVTSSKTSAPVQEDIPMPSTQAQPAAVFPARKTAILNKLRTVLKELSGQDQTGADVNASFLELGFDSLFLTQVAGAFRKGFGIKVTFRQLLEDYSTMDSLAGYLDAQLPAEVMQPTPPPVVQSAPQAVSPARMVPSVAPISESVADSTLERVIQEQLRVMAQQLETLRGGSPAPMDAMIPAAKDPAPYAPTLQNKNEPKAFGPYKPIDKAPGGGLTDAPA